MKHVTSTRHPTGGTRLPVTWEQAAGLGIASAPPKPTDNRRFVGETVQCGAIAPDVLAAILRSGNEARRDPVETAEVLTMEADMRADILASLGGCCMTWQAFCAALWRVRGWHPDSARLGALGTSPDCLGGF